MATRCATEVTVVDQTDATAVRCWYQLSASATLPAKPTTTDASATPSGWTRSEPTISSAADAAKYVYACWQTVWGDGTCDWGDVSMSASFEAAKVAWNKANTAQESIDNLQIDISAVQSTLNASRTWYAECPTAAGTAAKAATITPATTDFALNVGVMVNVRFTTTNSAAADQLTLSVNGTPAKPIKYMYNNARNNIPAVGYLVGGITYQFMYDGDYWTIQNMHYNTNTTYNLGANQHSSAIQAKSAITRYFLICGDENGYQHVAAGATFKLGYPILYAYGGAIKANATATNTYETYPGVNFSTTGTIASGAANLMLYLKVTISGNVLTVAPSPFMTTVIPTTEDGYVYIPLGIMTSATAGYFQSSKDLYAYLDGAFRQVTPTEIVATQRIYYRCSASTMTPDTSITKPTAWVTESGDKRAANLTTAANWSLKKSSIAASTAEGQTKYLYLYTCEQRKRLDGTVDYTTVVIDDGATVIDGGQIVTNSITATQIAANTVTANEIDATDLHVAAANIDGTLTASQINASGLTIGQSQVDGLQAALDGKQPTGDYATNAQAKWYVNTARTWYAECSTAAGTAAKVATITPATTDFKLAEGATVAVKFTYSNSVASPTLSVNGTEAKDIKRYGTTAPSTSAASSWNAGNVVTLVYDGAYWQITNWLNNNDNYYDRENYKVPLAASVAIAAARVAALGSDDKLKILAANSAFDISGPILYVAGAYSATDVTNATKRSTNYTFWGTAFTIANTHAVADGAAGKPVYIVGTLSGNLFTPNSTVLTCTVPTSADGLVYMRLGIMTASNAAVLESQHPLYMYFNGAFQQCDPATADASKTATNYISADSTGIRIANADPATATTYQHQTADSTTFYAEDTGGNAAKRTKVSADGLTVYMGTSGNEVDVASFGSTARIGKANGDRVVADSTNGITIYKGNSKRLQTTANGVDIYGSDGTTSVASFGSTTRVGSSSGKHLTMGSDTIEFAMNSSYTPMTIGLDNNDGRVLISMYEENRASPVAEIKSGTSNASIMGMSLVAGDPNVDDFSTISLRSYYKGTSNSGDYACAELIVAGVESGLTANDGTVVVDPTGLDVGGNVVVAGDIETNGDLNAASADINGPVSVYGALTAHTNVYFGADSTDGTALATGGTDYARFGYRDDVGTYNYLTMGIDSNGDRYVNLSSKVPWLEALGLYETTSATCSVGAAASSVSINSVRKFGNVVTVTLGSITLASAVGNGSYSGTIATVPSGYRPATNVYAAAVCAGTNIGGSYFRINTSGVVALNNESGASIASGKVVSVTLTYVI